MCAMASSSSLAMLRCLCLVFGLLSFFLSSQGNRYLVVGRLLFFSYDTKTKPTGLNNDDQEGGPNNRCVEMTLVIVIREHIVRSTMIN